MEGSLGPVDQENLRSVMNEDSKLTCSRIVVVTDITRNLQGKLVKYHKQCSRWAEPVVLKGDLTETTAILCWQHRQAAEKELKQQTTGKKTKEPDSRQMSLLD